MSSDWIAGRRISWQSAFDCLSFIAFPVRCTVLILSRREDESVLIGNNIRVTVVRIEGGRIKIGIEAPKDVSVDRPEVREKKERKVQHVR